MKNTRTFRISQDLSLRVKKNPDNMLIGSLISQEEGSLTLTHKEIQVLRSALIIAGIDSKYLEGKTRVNVELNLGELGESRRDTFSQFEPVNKGDHK